MSVNRVNIGSDNGLSPSRHQAIIWNNAWLLSIKPLGTNVSEIIIKIQNFSFMKMYLKISSAKWRPFCPGGDELTLEVSMGMPSCNYQYCDALVLVVEQTASTLYQNNRSDIVRIEGTLTVDVWFVISQFIMSRDRNTTMSRIWPYSTEQFNAIINEVEVQSKLSR